MYLRERKSNVSIEKAIYIPAQRNEQGAVIKPPVRSTKYLGSIYSWTRFKHVPEKVLAELNAEEISELKNALAKNEPKEFSDLDALPHSLAIASRDLKDCVTKYGLEEAKKILAMRLKAVDKAWDDFFGTAQALGLKRKANRAGTKSGEQSATNKLPS